MPEAHEVCPAASSNCYMQVTDYLTYLEDSPAYSGRDVQAVPGNSIYMEQAWAVNQPYTCSYPGNLFKSKDSDLDMALSQYSQPAYLPEEKPFPQVQSPPHSQKKGRDSLASVCFHFVLKFYYICFFESLHLSTGDSKLKTAIREVAERVLLNTEITKHLLSFYMIARELVSGFHVWLIWVGIKG